MSDAELIARLRDADLYNAEHYERDPLHKQSADRIEALIAERDEAWKRAAHAEKMWGEAEVKLAQAVEKFAALEKAASDVARRGAETGPQWTKLTIALLVARATLAAVSETHKIKGESRD